MPLVEGFLPAILPLVRTGIRIIGRQRVANFIAGAIGTLIRPLVGPSVAPGLGKAIADLGLRALVQAEVGEAPPPARVGNQALASTVEETVRMLAEQPDVVLESPALLEAAVLESFEAASAANMPPEALRPAVRESTVPGVWIDRPARGPRMYRRFTHVFELSLSPQALAGVRTFGGQRLDQWMHDATGQSATGPIKARIHLFQAMPRTALAHRSARARALAVSRTRRSAGAPAHRQAAGVLLQQPRLGRGHAPPPDRRLQPGQRLYFIELDRPFASSFAPKVYALVPSSTGLRAELRLSEAMAQRLAVAVREGKSAGQLVHRLRQALRGIEIPAVGVERALGLVAAARPRAGARHGDPEDGITLVVHAPAAGAPAERVVLLPGLSATGVSRS